YPTLYTSRESRSRYFFLTKAGLNLQEGRSKRPAVRQIYTNKKYPNLEFWRNTKGLVASCNTLRAKTRSSAGQTGVKRMLSAYPFYPAVGASDYQEYSMTGRLTPHTRL